MVSQLFSAASTAVDVQFSNTTLAGKVLRLFGAGLEAVDLLILSAALATMAVMLHCCRLGSLSSSWSMKERYLWGTN